MIHLPSPLVLSAADAAALQTLQTEVDAAPTYADQVVLADKKWSAKNQALFQRVRDALEAFCPGARRCGYCEDSRADEIEHVRPKNWFPDQAFRPDNYLFSCGPCNSPKGNAYAVVTAAGHVAEAVRNARTGVQPPPAGQEAFLHPRYDNALNFLYIDLTSTFRVLPRTGLSPMDEARARYTMKVLRLDLKDPLVQGRREAFGDFAGRLKGYYQAVRAGASSAELKQQRDEILKKQHISVWREMQRQAATPLLSRLFALVPGADQW